MDQTNRDLLAKVTTPRGGGGAFAILLRARRTNLVLARFVAWLGRRRNKGPLLVSKKLALVITHQDVLDVFRRDSDFLIAPTNRDRFVKICGPFVLCMDRSPEFSQEHKAMYSALAGVDLSKLADIAASKAEDILAKSDGTLDAVSDYLWPVCAHTAQRMFGISRMDFDLFRHVARAMFYHIFFNANGNQQVIDRAVAAGELLSGWLLDEMRRRRTCGELGEDFMGQLMRRTDVDEDMIRRTLAATLVGSIDTIAGTAARLLVTLGNNVPLRAKAVAAINNPEQLSHYCMEGLRLWPHNPFLARQAGADTQVRGTKIRAGQKLMLMTGAAMFDEAAFPDPRQSKPDRSMSSYLHFGVGIHACSGRALSELLMPMLVGKLLERNYRIVSAMKWAGPFPDSLIVRLQPAAGQP